MNKLLGALAVSAVLTGSTYANPFSDVPAGHWAYGAVNSVVNSGMMKGYPKGMFKGKETVNRYQMATIISRLLKRAGGSNDADVRRTLDRLGEEFMDELDLIGARLTALEGAFNEHVNEGGDASGFKFSGEARVRWENRTEDLTQPAAPAAQLKDDRSRFQTRTLLNVEKSVDKADFFVQLQHDKTFGSQAADANNLDLNQAWVSLAVTDKSSLKLGRQTLVRGNGSILGRDDHLQNPNSFDGWVFDSSYDDIKYSLWSFRSADDNGPDVDTDLHGLDLYFTDVYEGDLHVHYYKATGLNVNNANPAPLGDNLNTYGFDWSRDYEDWDVYVQYATQSGDMGGANGMDYEGELWNLAVGYDLDEDNKLGVAWSSYSGEDVPAAGANTSFEGWIPLASDTHNLLGFADVFAPMNIEDITFTWDRKINARNSFHLAYHMFSLENSTSGAFAARAGNGLDDWAGYEEIRAGVAQNQPVGNPGADDDLGTELDLVWKHQMSEDVSLSLGYAAFDAGDYFTANQVGANSPDVTYSWINANVKF